MPVPDVEKIIHTDPIEDYYEVGSELGRGKFAIVKRCKEKRTGNQFAAKVLRKRRRGKSCREEILVEIDVMRQAMDHDRIIKLYQVFETENEFYIIIELATGGELFRVIAVDPLPEDKAREVVWQLLQGVYHLHNLNIVHMDLKPENILLYRKGSLDIKIADFGLAVQLREGQELRNLVGTAEYVAPEVLNFEPLSIYSDMWSIGALTYALLTGYSPFQGDTHQETFLNVSTCDYNFEDEMFSNVSQEAKDFIEELLVIAPKKRLPAAKCLLHPWIAKLRPNALNSSTSSLDSFPLCLDSSSSAEPSQNSSNSSSFAPAPDPTTEPATTSGGFSRPEDMTKVSEKVACIEKEAAMCIEKEGEDAERKQGGTGGPLSATTEASGRAIPHHIEKEREDAERKQGGTGGPLSATTEASGRAIPYHTTEASGRAIPHHTRTHSSQGCIGGYGDLGLGPALPVPPGEESSEGRGDGLGKSAVGGVDSITGSSRPSSRTGGRVSTSDYASYDPKTLEKLERYERLKQQLRVRVEPESPPAADTPPPFIKRPSECLLPDLKMVMGTIKEIQQPPQGALQGEKQLPQGEKQALQGEKRGPQGEKQAPQGEKQAPQGENSIHSECVAMLESTKTSLSSTERFRATSPEKMARTQGRSGALSNTAFEKPKISDVMKEAKAEPVVKEAKAEPVVKEAKAEPVVKEAKAEPVVKEAKAEPVVKEAKAEPVVKEAKAEPVVKEAKAEPVVKEAKAEPVVKEAKAEPVVKEAKAEPVVKEAKAEPVVKEAKAEPVVKEAKAEPVVKEAKAEPVVKEAKAEPVVKEAKAEPVVKEAKQLPLKNSKSFGPSSQKECTGQQDSPYTVRLADVGKPSEFQERPKPARQLSSNGGMMRGGSDSPKPTKCVDPPVVSDITMETTRHTTTVLVQTVNRTYGAEKGGHTLTTEQSKGRSISASSIKVDQGKDKVEEKRDVPAVTLEVRRTSEGAVSKKSSNLDPPRGTSTEPSRGEGTDISKRSASEPSREPSKATSLEPSRGASTEPSRGTHLESSKEASSGPEPSRGSSSELSKGATSEPSRGSTSVPSIGVTSPTAVDCSEDKVSSMMVSKRHKAPADDHMKQLKTQWRKTPQISEEAQMAILLGKVPEDDHTHTVTGDSCKLSLPMAAMLETCVEEEDPKVGSPDQNSAEDFAGRTVRPYHSVILSTSPERTEEELPKGLLKQQPVSTTSLQTSTEEKDDEFDQNTDIFLSPIHRFRSASMSHSRSTPDLSVMGMDDVSKAKCRTVERSNSRRQKNRANITEDSYVAKRNQGVQSKHLASARSKPLFSGASLTSRIRSKLGFSN